VREYPEDGATKSSAKYEHIWQTTWRYTPDNGLDSFKMLVSNCQHNTKYYDVNKELAGFTEITPFCTHLFVVTLQFSANLETVQT